MSAAEARRRHPSTRSPVPSGQVVSRVVRLLEGAGVRWPHVAAAVLQVRGRAGAAPDELAWRFGIAPDVVRSAEAGELSVEELPEPLRAEVEGVLLDAASRWSA